MGAAYHGRWVLLDPGGNADRDCGAIVPSWGAAVLRPYRWMGRCRDMKRTES
jgi:hypothetical protein